MNRAHHNEELRRLDRENGEAQLLSERIGCVERIAKSVAFVLFGIAAVMFAGSAHARDIAAMPNKAGGQIVLTDIPSTNGKQIAYSRASDGTTIFGYWVPGENFIIVKWDGGSLKTFEYDDFQPLPRQMLAPAAPDMRL